MVTFSTSPSPGARGSPGPAFPFTSSSGKIHEHSGYGHSPVRSNSHGNSFGQQAPQSYSASTVSVFSPPKLSREPACAVTPLRLSVSSPTADDGHGIEFGKTSFLANVSSPWSSQPTSLSFYTSKYAKEPRQYRKRDNEQQQQDESDVELSRASQSASSNLCSKLEDEVAEESQSKHVCLEEKGVESGQDDPVPSLLSNYSTTSQRLVHANTTTILPSAEHELNRKPEHKQPEPLASKAKTDNGDEDDVWGTFLVKKGKKGKKKMHMTTSPTLPPTEADNEAFANNVDDDWGCWGISNTQKKSKQKKCLDVEEIPTNAAPESSLESKGDDDRQECELADERMDVDGHSDVGLPQGDSIFSPQPQPVPPDGTPNFGKTESTPDPSKRTQSQEQDSTFSNRKTEKSSHYGYHYSAYSAQPQTRTHIRSSPYISEYRPVFSPRYTTAGEYAAGPRLKSDSRRYSSSRKPDGPPKRERRIHPTYYRTSEYENADEAEVIEIDGMTYFLPSSKRPKRSYNHYPTDSHRYYKSPYERYHYDNNPYYTSVTQRPPTYVSRSCGQSSANPQRQATARPTSLLQKTIPVTPKATEVDAKKHRIPAGYSLKNWNPSEDPIVLLGSVFDANSLGKWIYDWTAYHHGPATPMADIAGELWILLIQIAGKIKRSEEHISHIRTREDQKMVEDFIESGERLQDKFRALLKRCEAPMLKADKRKSTQLGNPSGIEFVESLFGRERQLERTEHFMQAVRLWNLRFDANCEEILRTSTEQNYQVAPRPATILNGSSLTKANEKVKSPSLQSNEEVPRPGSSTEQNDMSKKEVSSSDTDEISDEEVAETLEDGHPLLQEVPTLVQIMLGDFAAWKTCKGNPGSSKATKPRSSNNGQNSARPEKRGRQSDDGGASDDEGRKSTKDTKRRKADSEEDELPVLPLACPYYKHDKVRHQKCLKLILKRIKDVKQHLYRLHKQPQYCAICGQVFGDKEELDEHLISRSCERREFQYPEGITEKQEKSLKSRVDKTLPLAEQWKSVWRIVFPNEEPPESPFVQGPMQEGLAGFREFRNERGPAIISDYVQSYVQSHISNEERTLSALLETVSSGAVDVLVEAYGRSLSTAQEDDGTVSLGNSGVATPAIASQGHSYQELVGRPSFSVYGIPEIAGIDVPMLPAANPDQMTGDVLSQSWTATSSVPVGATSFPMWQDLHGDNFGNRDFNHTFSMAPDDAAGPFMFGGGPSIHT